MLLILYHQLYHVRLFPIPGGGGLLGRASNDAVIQLDPLFAKGPSIVHHKSPHRPDEEGPTFGMVYSVREIKSLRLRLADLHLHTNARQIGTRGATIDPTPDDSQTLQRTFIVIQLRVGFSSIWKVPLHKSCDLTGSNLSRFRTSSSY